MTEPASRPPHIPVLGREVIEWLAPRAGGIYVDATFGAGGYSRAILDIPKARVIGIDRDRTAIVGGFDLVDRSEGRLTLVEDRFSNLAEVCAAQGADTVDGVVMDIGVSSMQLDQAARGFSFRADGPLDMRMDPTQGESAAQWLAMAEEKQIREVVHNYGEERFAKQIAAAIVAARGRAPIERTGQLADLVAKAVRTREPGQNPATRTFQALRLHVNRELEEVSLMLPQATAHLALDGRLAVISFHSLEDRIVKRFIQQAARRGFQNDVPRGLPLRESEMPQPALRIVERAQRASTQETRRNPRARSAILRVAARTAGTFPSNFRIEPGAQWRN
jgi:16S rRNA (cytosine1402-N4)-methyltransferase